MFTVCYNGLEKSFDDFDAAADFCDTLMPQKIGSDIWCDGELYCSYVYNIVTDSFVYEY